MLEAQRLDGKSERAAWLLTQTRACPSGTLSESILAGDRLNVPTQCSDKSRCRATARMTSGVTLHPTQLHLATDCIQEGAEHISASTRASPETRHTGVYRLRSAHPRTKDKLVDREADNISFWTWDLSHCGESRTRACMVGRVSWGYILVSTANGMCFPWNETFRVLG